MTGHSVSNSNDDEQSGKRKKSAQSSSRPPMAKRSMVWQHFTVLEDNKDRAKCNYCAAEYKCNSKVDGVTNLRKHLERCRAYAVVKAEQDANQAKLASESGEEGTSNMVLSKGWSQEACRRAVTKMIILGELPLSFVDNKGFRHFCSVAVPLFLVPSRRTVSRDVMELYMEEKVVLKSLISANKYRVSLTTDIWTSVQNMSYMVVTAHFIDNDWSLNRKIISFSVIEDHKGRTIGKKLEACLLDWGIERVFTITVDNASANDVAINFVKRQLLTWRNDDALVLRGNYMHVRCCAHVLNLIVSDGLKDLHSTVVSIRNAVKYVRSSTTRLQTFKQCVEYVKGPKGGVIMDCCTRWNSTYLMLMTALKFQAAFDRMAEVDKPYEAYFQEEELGNKRVGPPGSEDWENAERIVKFLKIFYDATLTFSASLTVTSHLCYDTICMVESSLTALERSSDLLMFSMANSMRKKYDKYWDSTEKINKLVIVAAVLDPRAKMGFPAHIFGILFSNDTVKVDEMCRSVKSLLNELFDAYSASYAKPTQSGSGSSQAVVEDIDQYESRSSVMDDATDDMLRVVRPFFGYAQKVSIQKESIQESTEVDRYLLDPVEDPRNENLNVLLWWKLNGSKYPILERIARDVLAVPVSTVSSESAFSNGGRIIDDYRSSLTPTMIEALICTENWLQAKLFASPTYDITAEIREQMFQMDLQEEYVQSQQTSASASAMQQASIDIIED